MKDKGDVKIKGSMGQGKSSDCDTDLIPERKWERSEIGQGKPWANPVETPEQRLPVRGVQARQRRPSRDPPPTGSAIAWGCSGA